MRHHWNPHVNSPNLTGNPEREPLYSTKDLAEKFDLHKDTVHRFYKEGKLPTPSCKIGTRNYWTATQVRSVIEGTWTPVIKRKRKKK